MALNDLLLDIQLRRAVGVRRFESGLSAEVIRLLRLADRSLASRLASASSRLGPESWSAVHLQRTLAGVRSAELEAYAGIGRRLTGSLKDFAVQEGGFQVARLSGTLAEFVPLEVSFAGVTDELLRAVTDKEMRLFTSAGKQVRRTLGGALSSQALARGKVVEGAIRSGVLSGEDVEQLTRRIVGTRAAGYRDGLLEVSRREARAIVRTSVTHTTNQARALVYQANADVIKALEWVSTLDGRTSPICRGRDGQTWPPEEAPQPPAHYNCRSVLVPVTKSFEELGLPVSEAPLGTRASMNGQVAARTTYSSWLRRQPAGFQDSVLGKRRGRLFRANRGMELSRFVDSSGHQYTLRQLAAFDDVVVPPALRGDRFLASPVDAALLEPAALEAAAVLEVEGAAVTALGHSRAALTRWMGKQGFSNEEALAVFRSLGVEAKPSSVSSWLGAGRRGSGVSAPVTALEEVQVRLLAGKLDLSKYVAGDKVFGGSRAAVTRWMGAEGYTLEEALAVYAKLGVEVKRSSVSSWLGAGRRGSGVVAKVSAENAAVARTLRGPLSKVPVKATPKAVVPKATPPKVAPPPPDKTLELFRRRRELRARQQKLEKGIEALRGTPAVGTVQTFERELREVVAELVKIGKLPGELSADEVFAVFLKRTSSALGGRFVPTPGFERDLRIFARALAERGVTRDMLVGARAPWKRLRFKHHTSSQTLGHSGAAATFSPNTMTMNMVSGNGIGTWVHEFGHFFDYSTWKNTDRWLRTQITPGPTAPWVRRLGKAQQFELKRVWREAQKEYKVNMKKVAEILKTNGEAVAAGRPVVMQRSLEEAQMLMTAMDRISWRSPEFKDLYVSNYGGTSWTEWVAESTSSWFGVNSRSRTGADFRRLFPKMHRALETMWELLYANS